VPRSVADRLAALRHAGSLDGADVGEAAGGERLVVRVGLWRDGGRVARARFRATTCASLLAYAEAACELLEAGADPGALGSEALRAAVAGVHPGHYDRAALVVAAVRVADARARGGSP
jgi:NifU-like protein involved in Fe-S cluster formation